MRLLSMVGGFRILAFLSGDVPNRQILEVPDPVLKADRVSDRPVRHKGQSGYCTSMPRFRLVFARLEDFSQSKIDTVIPLLRKILQSIKSLTDLTRQLMQYPD